LLCGAGLGLLSIRGLVGLGGLARPKVLRVAIADVFTGMLLGGLTPLHAFYRD